MCFIKKRIEKKKCIIDIGYFKYHVTLICFSSVVNIKLKGNSLKKCKWKCVLPITKEPVMFLDFKLICWRIKLFYLFYTNNTALLSLNWYILKNKIYSEKAKNGFKYEKKKHFLFQIIKELIQNIWSRRQLIYSDMHQWTTTRPDQFSRN